MIDTLFFLIPKKEICKLNEANITEELVEWGDETLSQEPREFSYKLKHLFIYYEIINVNYYNKFIINSDNAKDYACLYLKNDDPFFFTDILEVVNKKKHEINNLVIVSLLNDLYKTLDNFYIIIMRDEEIVDEKYRINNIDLAVKSLLDCFKSDGIKGVVIFKSSK